MPSRESHATNSGTPISRRAALILLGTGTGVAATGGLGLALAACGPAAPAGPVWTAIGIDPADLPAGEPVRVPLTATWESGSMEIATWLLRGEDGSLTAYSPRCTHAACDIVLADDGSRFTCPCHEAAFALDGTVLEGPPPRPLDRWALRATGATVEVEVTGSVRPSPAA